MYALIDISNQMLEDSAFDMEGEIRANWKIWGAGRFSSPARPSALAGRGMGGAGCWRAGRFFRRIPACRAPRVSSHR